MEEKWKFIPGYEGIYEASTLGRIRTCEGKTTRSARFEHRVWKQRILKYKYQARKSGRKDARVTLWKDGAHKDWLVSRLVAMTWCDGYKPSMTVNHIDGNPENNTASNLEWLTLGDNIRAGFADGLYTSQRKVVLTNSDGVSTEFRSLSAASRYLGKCNGYISNTLAKGYGVKGYSIRIM